MSFLVKVLLLIAVGITGYYTFNKLMHMDDLASSQWHEFVIISPILLIVTLYCTIHALTASIIFSMDSVTYKNFLITITLPFAQISGRKEEIKGTRNKMHYYILVPNNNEHSQIKFSQYFSMDKQFWDWFYSLHNLDVDMTHLEEEKLFGS